MLKHDVMAVLRQVSQIHDSDMITGHPLEKVINGPAHHTLHHLYFTVNYGQVNKIIFDRVMNLIEASSILHGQTATAVLTGSQSHTLTHYSRCKHTKSSNEARASSPPCIKSLDLDYLPTTYDSLINS